MKSKLSQLAERRQLLIEQSAAQRLTLEANLTLWRKPLALADRGLAAVRYIKENPIFTVGATALLTFLRPQSIGKWLARGLMAFKITRNITSWLQK